MPDHDLFMDTPQPATDPATDADSALLSHAQNTPKNAPLAERLRPQSLRDIAGQAHLIGDNAPIAKMVADGAVQSLILWGPPGCGKTTLARLIAQESGLRFRTISAIFSGVADLKKIFEEAKHYYAQGRTTLLFVDEIHRFNKAQQDAFLPHVERGTIILIGATTENPSFSLNSALLSRCPVYVLNRLSTAELDAILTRAETLIERPLPITQEARESLLSMADGDGRFLLNMTQQIDSVTRAESGHDVALLDGLALQAIVQKRAPIYDSNEESHYNLISALHKSVRGSDPDAALYWFCRMLDGGEDPHFLARRITRMAAEDIGLAAPQALQMCISAWQTYERLGSPEGELALAQALVYLATAPKSNAVYTAYKAAMRAAKDSGSLAPPKHILNAPTSMMKNLGYGHGYAYDHDVEDGFSGQDYFPEELGRQNFYAPKGDGFEKDLKARLDHLANLRAKKSGQSGQ